MYEALRKGASVNDLYEKTHIKPWFIEQMKELVELEEEILIHQGRKLPDELLKRAKQDGFRGQIPGQAFGNRGIRNPRSS
jgi:carbamoyl-phosphate synthase large subunit